jgi:hypothetical protein
VVVNLSVTRRPSPAPGRLPAAIVDGTVKPGAALRAA